MADKGRITYVDTAKFLAIWMVIVSHSCMHSDVARYLFAFHVPMFFFLYGYVYHVKEDRQSLKAFLSSKVPALFGRVLVPYFLFAFILGEALSVKTLPFVLWGSLQSLNPVTSTHLWFLPCYFLAVLIWDVIMELSPRNRAFRIAAGGVIVLLSATSAILNGESDIQLSLGNYIVHLTGLGDNSNNELYVGFPMAVNVAFTGVTFIYSGYLVRRLLDKLAEKPLWNVIIMAGAIFLGTLCFKLNHGDEKLIAMSYARYGNYLLFLAAAVLLSTAALLISKYIDNRLFAKLGKYTLAIYGFHLTLTFFGETVARLIHISNSNIQALVVGTITLALSCAIIPVIRYIDPYLLGERKK